MFAKYLFLFCILGQVYFLQEVSCAADSTDISRLRAKLLENYDRFSRPVQNHNESTIVRILFYNNGFEIDEQRNMITFHLLTMLMWEDQHLKWDPLNYGNLSELTFPSTELWTPEVSVINNLDESEIDHFGNTLMYVVSDSTVWWIPPTKYQVHCSFDFRLWPYDKQFCQIILSSWTHHAEEIDLQILDNVTEFVTDSVWHDPFIENREWKLIHNSVSRNRWKYCCPDPEIPIVELVDIIITVDVQRRSTAITAAVTVVGLVIAAALLISFWLDPFAQERLPLSLLILLLNAVFLQYMYRIIPNNGSTVPLAICFFRDSLIMVTVALAWSVGIHYMARIKRNSPVPLPEFIQTFLSSFAATVLCLNPRAQSKGQAQRKFRENSEGDDGDVSELVGEDVSDIQEDWEWLARFLDRIAFFAYLITYIIFILAFL